MQSNVYALRTKLENVALHAKIDFGVVRVLRQKTLSRSDFTDGKQLSVYFAGRKLLN